MSTEEQNQAKYEEEAHQRILHQREHEVAQMREEESRLREENRMASQAAQAESIKKRRYTRAQATKLDTQYSKFAKQNPDPTNFSTYNRAELEDMRSRAEEVKSALTVMDEAVCDSMTNGDDGEMECELETQGTYLSKLNMLLACCHIVESERMTEAQVRLNESLSGISPANAPPASPFVLPILGPRKSHTPAYVPMPSIASPSYAPPEAFSSPGTSAASFAPGHFFPYSVGTPHVAPVTSVTYAGVPTGGYPGYSGGGVLHAPPPTPYPKYSGVKTPEIKLPEFAGDTLAWPSFIDRFMCLIDKDIRFSEVHKLEYLKSSLKGEPARMLQNLQSLGSNYPIALAMLKGRFEDEWPLVNKHWEVLNGFKQIVGKSSKELRRLHEVFSVNAGGLAVLGYPFDNWVCILLIASKLDQESREMWEKVVVELPRDPTSGKITVPSYALIMGFIDQRARTLEHSGLQKFGSTGNGGSKKTTTGGGALKLSAAVHQNQAKGGGNKRLTESPGERVIKKSYAPQKCVQCNEADRVWSCKKFAELSVEARKAAVAGWKLCFNCLGAGHNAPTCTSKFSCKTCKKKHHTLLHVPETS